MNNFIKFAGLMRKVLLFFISCLLLLSCKDSYNYVSRKGTLPQKYEYAKKYFDKKKYSKSQPLLEEIYPLFKGKKEAEDIYYMLAYSHYKLHDYLLASYHFDNFTQQYSLSSRVEECAFMHSICEFYKSLPPYLDQSITENAIKQFQLFINNYPDSKYMAQCNEHIDILRAKLHKKAYSNAMLYYQIGDYKAASVAFANAIKDYPDLPQKEEFEFLIVKSNYLYSKNSIIQLQVERYKKALESSKEFYAEHSQSPSSYAEQMKNLVLLINTGIEKAEKEIKRKEIEPINPTKTVIN
jgi:outer membrane protein assembly factor BamD